jgi:hypothetical protein
MMRTSVPKSLFLAILGLICFATGAFATQSFTLTSAGPANLGGVYTSPYTATIDGVSNIAVFCDDFIDDVYIGETWQVNATNLSQLPLLDPNSPLMWDTTDATKQVTDYITAAILATQLLNLGNPESLAAEEISWAIWDVFDPTAPLYSALYLPGYEPAIAAYLLAAQLEANAIVSGAPTLSAAVSTFSNVTIYTPAPKSDGAVRICPVGARCGLPQEFISVSMAEPASPLLLGFDFLAIGGLLLVVRLRKSKSQCIS